MALRFKKALSVLLAFGSGVVLGVALLDLLPEALRVGEASVDPAVVTLTVLIGFLVYQSFGRVLHVERGAPNGSWLSVTTLVVHSLMDGFGIGSAFRVAEPVGLLVALGVIAHDLVDGSNTVAFSLGVWPSPRTAFIWLVLDGLAPCVGILLSNAIRPSDLALSAILAMMAGGFIYLGAHQVIAGARASTPWRTLALSVAGVVFVFAVARLGAD